MVFYTPRGGFFAGIVSFNPVYSTFDAAEAAVVQMADEAAEREVQHGQG